MPELPEVETVCRGLRPVLEGRIVTKVKQNRPDLRFVIPENFVTILEGARVVGITRRAKYITMQLDNGWYVGWHLGMSGRMVIDDATRAEEKHDHIVLHNDAGQAVFFCDPRRFGYVFTAHADDIETCQHFAHLGPEPLGNHFHADYLYDNLKKRKTPIKNALLDQRIVVGLGNIYVCEALYAAGIHPETPSQRLKKTDIERLLPIIQDVLNRAIEAGGSSLKDYVQASGELGYFQHSFAVYGREGEACQKESCNGVIERVVQSGRSSFYCPVEQLRL